MVVMVRVLASVSGAWLRPVCSIRFWVWCVHLVSSRRRHPVHHRDPGLEGRRRGGNGGVAGEMPARLGDHRAALVIAEVWLGRPTGGVPQQDAEARGPVGEARQRRQIRAQSEWLASGDLGIPGEVLGMAVMGEMQPTIVVAGEEQEKAGGPADRVVEPA